jgi:hypothetical protein
LRREHRRGVRELAPFMDPRVLQATIDPPQWWHRQRDLLATRETVLDFSAHPVGECGDPFEKARIRFEASGEGSAVKPRISEQYGIRGLVIDKACDLRLPGAVDQIDILIAHFGRPPTIEGFAQTKREVKVVADNRPRQVELIRLIAPGLDRVHLEAPDGAVLVQIAFPAHEKGERKTE